MLGDCDRRFLFVYVDFLGEFGLRRLWFFQGGMKVRHAAESIEAGQDIILTLKDERILKNNVV